MRRMMTQGLGLDILEKCFATLYVLCRLVQPSHHVWLRVLIDWQFLAVSTAQLCANCAEFGI